MKQLDFESIGTRIRDIRIARGITQEGLAEAADVNPSHISNIEHNRVKISLSTLINVCNGLDTTVDYILANEYNEGSKALDNKILRDIQRCDVETKEQIIKIIEIIK